MILGEGKNGGVTGASGATKEGACSERFSDRHLRDGGRSDGLDGDSLLGKDDVSVNLENAVLSVEGKIYRYIESSEYERLDPAYTD
jgi:hypothetical protein